MAGYDEIQRLVIMREQAEKNIQHVIAKEVANLQNTGVTVRDVAVDTTMLYPFGERPRAEITGVRIDVRL